MKKLIEQVFVNALIQMGQREYLHACKYYLEFLHYYAIILNFFQCKPNFIPFYIKSCNIFIEMEVLRSFESKEIYNSIPKNCFL